jgi:hypothetical protein
MTDPLPKITSPWLPESPAKLRVVHSDGPSAVSKTLRGTDAQGPSAASAEAVPPVAVAPVTDGPADTPTDAATVSTDTPSVSVSEAVSVTDASVTPVIDADTTDADTGLNLPAIVEFGQEISRVTLFRQAAARNTGVVTQAGLKGLAKSRPWTSKPESLAGHRAWIASTEWVPADVADEGLIRFLTFLRKAWGWTIGLALTGAGNAIVWLRLPQHFILAAIVSVLLYMFVIR